MVSHDVGMPASFQHENLLLKGGHIVICEQAGEKSGYEQCLKDMIPVLRGKGR